VIDHTFTGTEYLDLVSAFLIGYRTFASPTELLDRLIQAFHASGPSGTLRKSNGGESGGTTRLCICNFLSKWIDFHLHDFLADTNLVNKLITFLDSNMQAHVPHNERTAIEKVKTTIKKKTRDVTVNSDENYPPSILPPLFRVVSIGLNAPFLVMDFDKTELARHLCTMEFEAFSRILPTECLGQAWNKKNKETKAPNITAIIKRFNEVSCWVSSMLVTTEELKARTAVLARFIEIADECRQFNNFNSVVAIVSGLESSAVHRLKKTWAGLPSHITETFEQLKNLMSTEKNYLTYRNVVKLANPPCIPYLGVFLTDLVFIDEAPDVLQPSGLINFDKWYKVAWVVREIRKFQVTHYSFRSCPEVLRTLIHLPALPENDIYSLSLKCEERAKA
jgi:son of sevenless-like protein